MKKTLLTLFLFIVVVFLTTCKKIDKYPIRMNGVWYAPKSTCGMMIEIEINGNGGYYSAASDKGCDNGNEKGKVKFTKHKLYIGHTSYKILEDPTINISNDSILAPIIDNVRLLKKYKIYATMKLRDSYFNGKNENIYYKYIEY